jgi:hypothetical protein
MRNKQLKKEQLLKESIRKLIREELPVNDPKVEQIIQMLKDLDVDGETMEYIITQVNMGDQMANQLVHNKEDDDLVQLVRYDKEDDFEEDGMNDEPMDFLQEKKEDEDSEETEDFSIEDDETETETDSTETSTDEESFDSDIDTSGLQGDTKELMAKLQDAMELARKTGDKKLLNQLGNTITFFTRTHIARPEEQEALAEEIKRLQFKAGIIK